MSDERLFILAGTYEQAMGAVRELPSDQRWQYVMEPRHLYGVRDEPYIIVGTFWDRRDAGELLALTRANRMHPLTCEWCGDQITYSGTWTSDNSGDYCPEGREVGPTGTSPHKLGARLAATNT